MSAVWAFVISVVVELILLGGVALLAALAFTRLLPPARRTTWAPVRAHEHVGAVRPEWDALCGVRDRASALETDLRFAEPAVQAAADNERRLHADVTSAESARTRLAELEPRLVPLAGLRAEMAALANDAEGYARRTKLAAQREELVRQRTEAALRDNEARLEGILTSMADSWVIVYNAELRCESMWIPPDLEKRFDLHPENFVGRYIKDISPASLSEARIDDMRGVMDGFAVLEHLCAEDGTRDVPVMVLTAATTPAARERCIGLGVLTFITKPFDPYEVAHEIDTVVAGRASA
jgi:CheY-like chemotaxis protein